MKRTALAFLIFTVLFSAYSVNIRVLAESDNVLKCEGTDVKIMANDKVLNIKGPFAVSKSSAGLSVYYNERTRVFKSFKMTASYIKINGNAYRGAFFLYNLEGKVCAVLHLDLEEYVKGVLPGEMPVDWPKEALKAQAVLARTYGYFQILKHRKYYDLGSDNTYQIFTGNAAEYERVKQAVEETKDIVATYENYPIEIFYSSTCGGLTEDPVDLWGTGFPYLASVECGHCTQSPSYEWEYAIPMEELAGLITLSGDGVDYFTDVGVIDRTASGRIKNFEFYNEEMDTRYSISGKKLREVLDPMNLKSLFIESIDIDGFNIIFRGRGFGHGVGMCQWGAKTLADAGNSFKYIIDYYFRDISLSFLE